MRGLADFAAGIAILGYGLFLVGTILARGVGDALRGVGWVGGIVLAATLIYAVWRKRDLERNTGRRWKWL